MRSDASRMDSGGGEIVISDDSENRMQLLQNFYAKITGKKERISKEIKRNHITSFEDLENLHIKMTQVCAPLSVIHRNESIVIYHIDDSKEQFSSFNRFKAYNKSSLSPIENVHIEYNILLTQPGISDEQSYKVIIDVHSRASILKKMTSGNKMSRFILGIIADNTASVRIDYVDYVIAMNFMHAIDGWFHSLKCTREFPLLKFLKKNSSDFPFILKHVSLVLFLILCYIQISIDNSDAVSLFASSLVVFGSAYILGGISYRLGEAIERSVDTIYPPSYVLLNRGDEEVAELQASENRRGYIGAVGAFALALGMNIISSYVSYLLGIN